MSGAEAGFIIGLISGVISIIEAAKTVYDAAGNVKGQPEAFRQVAARLPLVIEILRCAEERVSSLDEPALDAIELILESCKAKADDLNKIFHKVVRKDDDKWFDRYKKALSTLRKGEKVEYLMEGILKDTQLLACEKLVGIATEVQVKGLEEGIKEMKEMPSSLQEEIGSVTQNHNGSGNNNANTGGGAMHAGTGDLFHNKINGDAYFGNNISSQQTDSQTRKYLKDLSMTDPREDKIRIEQAKGGLLKDSYCWILENPDFQQWRSDSQKPLLWIKGDPGKGKTMLLCGIIDEINKKKDPTALLSYFFCQATDSRINHATAVLRGLIYLLVDQKRSLISHIQKRYDQGPKNPFEGILDDLKLQGSIYLIVDALDECETDLPKLLDFIVQTSSISPRIKWIVSSRNLPNIERTLDTATQKLRLCLELNEKSVSVAVTKFIQLKVNQLTMRSKYSNDTQEAIQQYLTLNSNGTFLWVALVCQELSNIPGWKAQQKLTAFPPGLDALYQRMLSQIMDSEDAELCISILAVVSTVYRPITLDELVISVDMPDGVADDYEALTEIIGLCGSFLTLREHTIFFVHQSGKDYLIKTAFKNMFLSTMEDVHKSIFSRSLQAMSCTLRRNIYNLAAPGISIDQIKQPGVDPITPIKYSCIYWVDHLNNTHPGQQKEQLQDNDEVHKFLKVHFLHWLEAMSLIGKISECITAIKSLESCISVEKAPELFAFTHDAKRFVLHNRIGFEQAPLQIYCSALFFSPEESIIRKTFQECIPNWIYKISRTRSNWSAALQTLEGHSDWVRSIAFSPDALGCRNGRIASNTRGHSHSVDSVAFSPDGKVVASGSWDQTIRLWDVATGESLQTLEGHSLSVDSVAFSPDGKVLASGSGDQTIRLWDVATGESLQTLESHSRWVRSVAFSLDGKVVASGSNDQTIQLWDVATGESLQTLEGHSRSVDSVAFSPDGKVVASGSEDRTIRLWDVATGESLQTLKGHWGWVTSVAFSLDGKVIASGSNDQTIQLWDITTGESLQTLKGHSRSVDSVAFSPDGKVVASGSEDQTIRLWDVAIGESLQILESHSRWVRSVAFSPDGKVIASGSDDQTIRLWDVGTGESLQTLEGYSGQEASSAFERYSISNNWIVEIVDGEMRNTVWLPPDYRPSKTSCYKGTIAIGLPSGSIFILRLKYEGFIFSRSKQALV
ncbi:putative beta transducin-like protein [Botrytis fragariae]|uniref:Mitochondrial division protein 1 n=1 Tax=Botrytis fragariae TaxID=1964551 RepID=A0A8H6B254_9HELO|nr:putative beta transducin-like protein [Botrytis fragariae]KAF5877798.1 putative beta transducin-like protein [Botrytis fragariae]